MFGKRNFSTGFFFLPPPPPDDPWVIWPVTQAFWHGGPFFWVIFWVTFWVTFWGHFFGSLFWATFRGHFFRSLFGVTLWNSFCGCFFKLRKAYCQTNLMTFLTNFRKPTTKNDKYKILKKFIRRIYCFSHKITVVGFRSHVYRWKATIENPTLCV